MKLHILLSTIVLAASLLSASAHEFKVGDLLIGHPWSRETPGGATIGGGYLSITNNGKTPDRMLSATTTAAASVVIHEMAMKDGVMTMRPVAAGLLIEPGKTVTLAPGGLHLMLMGLKAPLKQGDRLPVTMVFEKAGKVDVIINVEGIGAQHPAPGADHNMHKM